MEHCGEIRKRPPADCAIARRSSAGACVGAPLESAKAASPARPPTEQVRLDRINRHLGLRDRETIAPELVVARMAPRRSKNPYQRGFLVSAR